MPVRRQVFFRFWLLPVWLSAALGLAALPASAEVRVVGTTADSVAASLDEAANRDDAAQLEALQRYIGDKYQVPLKAVRSVIDAAWDVGQTRELDPLLLLAVMAIESSFNPKAQSHKGAQGLMQVMTRIHHARFEPHGGVKTAFKPDVNIDVGAQILQECIDRRGSVAGGLTCYVGAPGKSSRYGQRVLAEFERLQLVAGVEAEGAAPAELPAPPSVLVAMADGAEPVVVVGPEAGAAPAAGDTPAVQAPAAVAAAEPQGAAGETAEAAAPTMVAQADEAAALSDPDAVIEAPPISRFVEASAPRVARTSTNGGDRAFDL